MANVTVNILGATICNMDGEPMGLVRSIEIDRHGVVVFLDDGETDDDDGGQRAPTVFPIAVGDKK